MECNRCCTTLDDKGQCPQCSAAGLDSAGGGWVGPALLLGALWVGKKILDRQAGSYIPQSAAAASGGQLPEEFRETRSRLGTEIPGQPEASRMAELQRTLEDRQLAMERMRSLLDHARTMNK